MQNNRTTSPPFTESLLKMTMDLPADAVLAAYLRSTRTTTQAQSDRMMSIHDLDTLHPSSRATAVLAHHTASPAGH